MVCSHLCELSRVVEFIETKSNMEVARGWRVVEWGVSCFVGPEFQFGKMNKFWRWMAMMAEQCEYT